MVCYVGMYIRFMDKWKEGAEVWIIMQCLAASQMAATSLTTNRDPARICVSLAALPMKG